MYASWNGSGWTTQTIEEYNTAYSIVLDAEDNPHISFRVLYKNTYYYYHDYIMYATATINAELSEPLSTFSDFNLLLILAIVISATAVTVVYVWKKYKSSFGLHLCLKGLIFCFLVYPLGVKLEVIHCWSRCLLS
jgi:hypothetical protein